MPEDIIDIIHRLSYEIDDTQLQRATGSISRQIKEINRLEQEIKNLAGEFSRTSADETAKRDLIIKKIAQNQAALKRLNGELQDNILHNKDLQNILRREQGIIGALNTKLDILRRKRDQATDVRAIRRFNREIAETGKELAQLADAKGATRSGAVAAFGSLRTVAALTGVTLGADALVNFGRQVVDVTVKYEKFRAVLSNTLGSRGAAEAAFRLISDYAAKTPFQVDEITNSFIKLTNRGVIPVQNQLRQIGDLAASQGKSFDQLVEAILDAQSLEFERLKEFGIIAKQSNDTVTLSFKDQTVTVKKNTEAIREAILALGDHNGVAGSTAAISDTLGGKISNLSDTWDRFLDTIGKRTAPALSAVLGSFTDFIEKLDDKIAGIGGKDIDTQVRESQTVQRLLQNFSGRPAAQRAKALEVLRKQLQGLIDIEATQLIPLEQREQVLSKKLKNSFLGDQQATAELRRIRPEITRLQGVRLNRQIFQALIKQLEDQERLIPEPTIPTQRISEDERKKLLKEAEDRLKNEEEYSKAIVNLAADTREKILLDTVSDEKQLTLEQKGVSTDRTNQLLQVEIDFLRKRARLYKDNVQQLKIIEAEISDRQLRQAQNDKALRDAQKQARDERFAGLDYLRDQYGIAYGDVRPDSGDEFVFYRRASTIDPENIEKAQKRLQDRQTEAEAALDRILAQEEEEARRLRERIELYDELATSAVSAYQTIIQAQEQQVQRDIDIQQNRVERAQAIADRGNAKALQAEEERLSTLQQERERYAQQQLALNAVQTLSSSILAVATAAGESGAGAIVIVPAVIAALAAGFAAVRALTNDVQAFRYGEVDIKGPGTSISDSIPARLSRGESVIAAQATAKHSKILEGMNAGRQYRLIDHDKIIEMAPGSTVTTVQYHPVTTTASGNSSPGDVGYRQLIKEVKNLREAIEAKPTSSWHLDRRGFVSMYQDEITFLDKMKKL